MGRGDAKYVGREVGEHLASKTPPGSFYTDETIFRRELEEFYYRSWMNLGREDQIARPGDFFTREIGGGGLIVVRGSGGVAGGFYNGCGPRGRRRVEGSAGSGVRSVVCPREGWSRSSGGALGGGAAP